MATLIVSVDVEEDMPEWRVQAQTTLRNLSALEGVQTACERLGVRPTYLCTWPVATRTDGALLGDWARAGRAEVGSLLHAWVTPPFDASESRLEAVGAHRLSTTALNAKLAALTEAVTARIGVAPRSFRSGGFSLNGATLQLLERHGYRVDCSVSPLMDGRAEGGVDLRDAPDVPYFPDRQFIDRRGASPVLEVPVSVGYLRAVPGGVGRALAHLPTGFGLAQRFNRASGLERHRLEAGTPFDVLCRLADVLVERDMPVLHLYLRSSEFLAGTSGGPRTAVEAQQHLEKTERFLAYAMHTLGVIPRTLSEFAESWAGGG